jgi:hypothetical protein
MLRWLACLVFAVSVTACTHTVGAKVDSDQFVKGKATMSDVITQLGPPSSQGTKSDVSGEQTTVLNYTWGTSGISGYEVEVTTFFFNKDKILVSTQTSKADSTQPQPTKN